MDSRKFNGADLSRTTTNSSNERLERRKINGGAGKGGKKRNKQSARCISPNWENFPTEPPICSRDDGVPSQLDGIAFSKWRNESIKGYGNAIVPQVVYQIFIKGYGNAIVPQVVYQIFKAINESKQVGMFEQYP